MPGSSARGQDVHVVQAEEPALVAGRDQSVTCLAEQDLFPAVTIEVEATLVHFAECVAVRRDVYAPSAASYAEPLDFRPAVESGHPSRGGFWIPVDDVSLLVLQYERAVPRTGHALLPVPRDQAGIRLDDVFQSHGLLLHHLDEVAAPHRLGRRGRRGAASIGIHSDRQGLAGSPPGPGRRGEATHRPAGARGANRREAAAHRS